MIIIGGSCALSGFGSDHCLVGTGHLCMMENMIQKREGRIIKRGCRSKTVLPFSVFVVSQEKASLCRASSICFGAVVVQCLGDWVSTPIAAHTLIPHLSIGRC